MEKTTVIAKKNPIIPLRGVCDPHMHVFGGRVWLYATHDAVAGSGGFVMHDWQIWSSADCVEWRLESVVRPEDFWMGASDCCWAVDAAERNGKYYFYYSNGNSQTGVAVADNPAGPFRDVLGKPLLDGTVTTTREYDPAIFRDDDGEYYIVFGGPEWAYGPGCGYYIARLGEDMISLAETPRKLELDHPGDDKASLNKWNGRYYLSYGGFYAISDSVYGPYRFMGHTGASVDHTSYFDWNGQIFNAITVLDHHGEYRSSGICYIHIHDDGTLAADQMIVEYGVGQYDGRWNRIEGVWYMKTAGGVKKENKVMAGFSLAFDRPGSAYYPNIRNLSGKKGIVLDGWGFGKGVVELREKSEDGRLLAAVKIPERGRDIQWHSRWVASADLPQPLGDTLDLCLVVIPDRDSEIRLDHFHFYGDAE